MWIKADHLLRSKFTSQNANSSAELFIDTYFKNTKGALVG